MSAKKPGTKKPAPLFHQRQAPTEMSRGPPPNHGTKSGYPPPVQAPPPPDPRKGMAPPSRRAQGGGDSSLPSRNRRPPPNPSRDADPLSDRDIQNPGMRFTPRGKADSFTAPAKVAPVKASRRPAVTVEDEEESTQPNPYTKVEVEEVPDTASERSDTESLLPDDRDGEEPPQYGEVAQDHPMQAAQEKLKNARARPLNPVSQPSAPRDGGRMAASQQPVRDARGNPPPPRKHMSMEQPNHGPNQRGQGPIPSSRGYPEAPPPPQAAHNRQSGDQYGKQQRNGSVQGVMQQQPAAHAGDDQSRSRHQSYHAQVNQRFEDERVGDRGARPTRQQSAPQPRFRSHQSTEQPNAGHQPSRQAGLPFHQVAPGDRRAPAREGYVQQPQTQYNYDDHHSHMPPQDPILPVEAPYSSVTAQDHADRQPNQITSTQDLMGFVSDLDRKNALLSHQAAQYKSQFDESVQERNQVSKKNVDLEQKLEHERLEYNEMRTELETVKREYLADKAKWKQKIGESMLKADLMLSLNQERIHRLEALNQDYIEQMLTMKSLVNSQQNAGAEKVQDTLATARKAIDESKQISQAFGETQKELDQVKGQLAEATEQLQKTQKGLDEVTGKLDDSQKANSAKDAIAVKSLQAADRTASSDASFDAVTALALLAKEQAAKMSELSTSIAVSQEAVRKLDRQNKALMTAYEVVLNYFDVSIIGMDGDGLQATHEALERALDNLTRTKSGYRSQLDKLKYERDTCQEKLAKMENSSNVTEAEKEAHQEAIAKLQKDLEAERLKADGVSTLKKEITRVQETLKAKEQEVAGLKEKDKVTVSQATAYKNAYTDNEKKYKQQEASLQQQLRELNASLEKAKAEVQAKDEQCKSVQTKLAEATAKAKTTGIGVSAAAQLESEKQKWQKLLDQKQAELEHAKDQEASMVKRWHAKDNTTAELALIKVVHDNARIELEHDVEEATAEKYREEIKNLKAQILKEQQGVTKWKTLYQNLQEETAEMVEDDEAAAPAAAAGRKATAKKASSSKTANQVGGFVKASAMHNSNKKRLNEHDGAQSGKSPKKARFESMNVSSDIPIPEYEDDDESSPLSQAPEVDMGLSSQMQRDLLEGLDDILDTGLDDDEDELVPATQTQTQPRAQPAKSQPAPAASQKRAATAKPTRSQPSKKLKT